MAMTSFGLKPRAFFARLKSQSKNLPIPKAMAIAPMPLDLGKSDQLDRPLDHRHRDSQVTQSDLDIVVAVILLEKLRVYGQHAVEFGVNKARIHEHKDDIRIEEHPERGNWIELGRDHAPVSVLVVTVCKIPDSLSFLAFEGPLSEEGCLCRIYVWLLRAA